MFRKTVSGIMLALSLMCMLTLAFNTQPVRAEYEFYDDFDSGLVQWNNFGDPTPSTFQAPGFHDGWGYSTKGDGWYQSGSWSKTLLNITHGIIVEFRVKQDEGDVWDKFDMIGVGKLQSGYSEDYWPYYFGVGIMGHNPNNSPEGTDDIGYYTDIAYYVEDAANDHHFHTYKIKYDGTSNEVEFYKDDSLITTLTAGERPYDELPLLISGRDYSNTNYLDWINTYVDNIPPEINAPVQEPPENVEPYQNVTVTVNVTDIGTGVYNVTLWYSINNGTTWMYQNMTQISANNYQAKIPGYENCTWVTYKIIAYDNVENLAVNDNHGYYYKYHVIPEFPTALLLPLFMILSILTTIIAKRRNSKLKTQFLKSPFSISLFSRFRK